MKRVVTPELLDDDLGTPEEIQNSLLDLYDLNSRFGGFRNMAAMLRTVCLRTARRDLSFLDVAGGTGDVAHQITRDLLSENFVIRATVLDRAISHMTNNGVRIPRVGGNALALPFADDSFDVVGCNLFCHHLEPAEVVTFFDEALRVARLCVIASDVRRSVVHWIAAYVGRLIYRSRLTDHDAPASVRRAYTISEMCDLAQRTTAVRHEVSPSYFQRFQLVLWKSLP